MILISQSVLEIIDEYVQYLIREGLTSNNRIDRLIPNP